MTKQHKYTINQVLNRCDANPPNPWKMKTTHRKKKVPIVILHNLEFAIIQCSLIQELIKLGNVCFNSQHQRTAVSTGAQSVNVNHAKKALSLNHGPCSHHYLHTYTQIRLCSMSTLHFYRSPANPICLHGTN